MPDIDYGQILEALNDKVDLSGSWSAPSTNYDNLTLGASGDTYTAPADGIVFFGKKVGANSMQYITVINTTKNFRTISLASSSGTGLSVYLLVAKSDIFKVDYTATGDAGGFRFIYAQKTN